MYLSFTFNKTCIIEKIVGGELLTSSLEMDECAKRFSDRGYKFIHHLSKRKNSDLKKYTFSFRRVDISG